MKSVTTLLFVLGLSTFCLFAAPQSVAGISLDVSVELKKTQEAKRDEKTAENNLVDSSVTYFGKNADDTMQVTVSEIKYVAQTKPEVGGAAKGAIANILRMPGVTNPMQAVAEAKVSGQDARRLSFVCDRMGKKVGIEALYVVKEQSLYIVQIVYVHSDTERGKAEKMLETVKLAD